ncbi:hypothetical protein DNI29_19420 [Hymenobacter sediminis]|uniref:hypothetical protein n=1 Tax=Hymenobacter sediminis TaxID=2218621 RepID=UPI000DA6D1A6|nr:hypothetical protein [Hymenobacter sediminis]RPD44873.1 hypothetical protein DNI29_19420 [Hymenobacter sediminis]
MTFQEEYTTTIQPEVDTLVHEVAAALSTKRDIANYNKGWRVFFGPIMSQPKVLIIGINPGNGQPGVVDIALWEDEEVFEYTNPEYNFALARETRSVFTEAGLLDVLTTATVKTNYYFLSTTKERDLYKITDSLGRTLQHEEEALGDKFFRKSAEWTKRLIELLEPQVILCEGKVAYENVIDLFPQHGEQTWENHCGFTALPDQGLTVVGYSRRWSNIKDKPGLARLLRRFVSPR